MWRNYLTVALRTLTRSPAYAAINIGGLALGLAGSLLILAYVNYERSYDSWLRDADRLYQVQTTVRPPNAAEVHSQASPFPFYEGLAGFSQVEAVTSLAVGKTVTEHDGQPMFIDATTVDPEFFKVFALPFVQGSAATAFPDTNSIVLTESEAIRQFGTADALGKRLSLGAGGGKRDHRVTGVLRDLPKNTSLRLGIIFRRDINQVPPESRGWGSVDLQHYVKLRPGADAAAVNAAILAWKKRAWPPAMFEGKPMAIGDAFHFRLVPLGDVHLGRAQEGALTPGGDPRALATFAIVALLTLGMAVMNFVNLTTARATQRAREVALRKVLGATRRQLIVQFLGESLLIAAAAMLIALTIAELTTPWIGHLMGADMRIAYLGERGMLLPALGLFAFAGLAGGLYPALYLSRFRPAQVLRTGRAAAETTGSGRLRAALVVVQFAVAIGLIASTAVIYSQTRFIERVDPGYRRDGLIQITNAWRFTQGAEYEAARPLMLAIPGVTGVGRAGLELGAPETPVRLMRGSVGAPWVTMGFYSVDADFLRTMGIGRLAGRLLGDRFAADRIAGATPADLVARGVNVVVNRSAAAKLGYRTPEAVVGQTFEIAFFAFPMVPSTIVGVVEDTRFRTARDAVDPIVYVYDPEHTSQVLVRYAGARPGEVMAGLNKVWRKFEPEIPFEARFAEDIVRELYAAERARGALFAGFSGLAVVIACLGLYSLAAFATERRTKEIGIRKVVGATVRDIVRLLVWQFSKPVVLANLIAWPAAWWAMRDWLNGFDARIALGPGPFALAGLLALAIALATVAGHALRVARMNPIHALRYE
ncbi:FtsX-like permease family protein [Sphingomonas sp. DT-204]|uniref:FtsX-like permease family protein n=1 Tax=Sphingomonas sp. DT-204 TaxID=3396166 RepID=UPI003F1D2DF8